MGWRGYAPQKGRSPAPNLFLRRRMMLPPVRSIPPAMHRNLSKDKFRGKPPFSKMRSNPLLRSFRRNLRIKKHQHRRSSSAQSRAQNS